ncbi:MAG: endonuclease/exonuclease/phosphatase family protein [Rhodothermales bacterium]|nr:endonuclease/exonuclease/phosphatase family protein [Rhodothermales bacterium]
MRFVLFLLLGCLGAACIPPDAPPAAPADATLKVMSFNIRYNTPNDSLHAWPLRKEHAASIIRFNQADVFGVQEALHGQLVDLDSLLPGYSRLGVGRDDGKEAGEYSAIYYRTDRFTPVQSGTFWLSLTPDVPGSLGWDAAITRVVTWAEYQDAASGQTFFHVNTHFDHRGEQARTESARMIVERIATLAGDTPVVLTGDFNFDPSAPGYALLTEAFTDTHLASETGAHGPETTFYGFTYTGQPGRRIDYIFTSPGIRTLRHATLSDSWDGAFASDHLPVFAEVRLNP